jgi:heme/copper-type cytochrome/quinol oxidase subunit 2
VYSGVLFTTVLLIANGPASVQSTSPILPAGNSAFDVVLTVLFLALPVLVVAAVIGYFVRLRRSSEAAAKDAATARSDVAALREELRRRSV